MSYMHFSNVFLLVMDYKVVALGANLRNLFVPDQFTSRPEARDAAFDMFAWTLLFRPHGIKKLSSNITKLTGWRDDKANTDTQGVVFTTLEIVDLSRFDYQALPFIKSFARTLCRTVFVSHRGRLFIRADATSPCATCCCPTQDSAILGL